MVVSRKDLPGQSAIRRKGSRRINFYRIRNNLKKTENDPLHRGMKLFNKLPQQKINKMQGLKFKNAIKQYMSDEVIYSMKEFQILTCCFYLNIGTY